MKTVSFTALITVYSINIKILNVCVCVCLCAASVIKNVATEAKYADIIGSVVIGLLLCSMALLIVADFGLNIVHRFIESKSK